MPDPAAAGATYTVSTAANMVSAKLDARNTANADPYLTKTTSQSKHHFHAKIPTDQALETCCRSLLALEHEVGGDDELGAGDVLDADVGDEAGGGGERPDEEAEGPLERHVAEDVPPAPRPPVLLEHVVLDQPAQEERTPSVQSSPEAEAEAEAQRENRAGLWGRRARVLVVEALDGADVGADERDLGGGVGVRVAAEEEPPPAPAPLVAALIVVLARRVEEEGRAGGGEQRGLDVSLRIRRAAAGGAPGSSVLGVPRSHRLGGTDTPPLRSAAAATRSRSRVKLTRQMGPVAFAWLPFQ